MNSTSFATAQLSDIEQIKPLMERVFGPYAELEEVLTKWIRQDHFSVMVAKAGAKVVGISTWCLMLDKDFSDYESFGPDAVDFLKSHKLACAMNLAVDPEYRRNSIGQRLSLAHLNWLESKDCTAVMGSSWVNGTNDNSQHLYLKAGFRKLGESQEFLRLNMQNGPVCSLCKAPECSCRSLLFGVLTSDLMKFRSAFQTV